MSCIAPHVTIFDEQLMAYALICAQSVTRYMIRYVKHAWHYIDHILSRYIPLALQL